MYKVITFTLQGKYICAIAADYVSGLKAHIQMASGAILYVSEAMSQEAAEAHCQELIKQLDTSDV